MLIFSLCVSAVFAGLLREEAHEQLVHRRQDVRRHDRRRAHPRLADVSVSDLISSLPSALSPTWIKLVAAGHRLHGDAVRVLLVFQTADAAGRSVLLPYSHRRIRGLGADDPRRLRARIVLDGSARGMRSHLYGVTDEYHQCSCPDELSTCRHGGRCVRLGVGAGAVWAWSIISVASERRCPLTTCSSA